MKLILIGNLNMMETELYNYLFDGILGIELHAGTLFLFDQTQTASAFPFHVCIYKSRTRHCTWLGVIIEHCQNEF